MARILGMIPARLQSTRLPGKALVEIEGLPMIVHTFKRAQLASSLDEVVVATDSNEIADTVRYHGGKVAMTGSHHPTGTDRIAEAVSQVNCDIVVNVQGDEPLLDPAHIDAVVQPLLTDPQLQVAILLRPYGKKQSSSDIKAVVNLKNEILYFSRNDLPSDVRTPVTEMLKMYCIVPFRKTFLLQFASWKPTPLECIEYNEYLRILEHGVKMQGVIVQSDAISVDTPEDLVDVKALMVRDTIKHRYLPA
jgi:3-deoxy-manno-octulosonate cytidylyltransferase (CMP-KDO synthetase)